MNTSADTHSKQIALACGARLLQVLGNFNVNMFDFGPPQPHPPGGPPPPPHPPTHPLGEGTELAHLQRARSNGPWWLGWAGRGLVASSGGAPPGRQKVLKSPQPVVTSKTT